MTGRERLPARRPAETPDLEHLHEALRQAHRQRVHAMAAQLDADPARAMPSGGCMSLLASIAASLAAVGAVLAEENRDGD